MAHKTLARLTIPTPSDFVLARDACSYGYFLLEPNVWTPRTRTFQTTLDVGDRAVSVRVRQASPGGKLSVGTDSPLDRESAQHVRRGLARILRLDEDAAHIAEFHALDPRWTDGGRGRLMRSPSFFEDVIKTVTSCNVAWPSTIIMNKRLCQTVGRASPSGSFAFPTPEKLARTRPASLRARCSVGYRDARIVAIARMFSRGEVDQAWFENPATPDDRVHDALIEWPGIGPYAAANIMQLLGRYQRLPLDSESVRHGRDVLGFKGSARQVMKRVTSHFDHFGRHRFRAYWFEVWDFYERKRGPSWTWERETTGKSLTADKLRKEDFAQETPPTTPQAPTPRRKPKR